MMSINLSQLWLVRQQKDLPIYGLSHDEMAQNVESLGRATSTYSGAMHHGPSHYIWVS